MIKANIFKNNNNKYKKIMKKNKKDKKFKISQIKNSPYQIGMHLRLIIQQMCKLQKITNISLYNEKKPKKILACAPYFDIKL